MNAPLRPPRRVLIAGCGDLGGRLARRLLAAGDEVFGLRRNVAALPPGVQPVAADLLDTHSLQRLPEAIDAVVCSMTPASRDAAGYRRAYIEAPLNLVEAMAPESPRWLFVSSTAVYAGDDGRWIDDDSPAAPQGFNGQVLLEAERSLAARLPHFLALRLSGIYGPGRRMMLRRAASGGAVRPHWGNRIHADDAAAAIAFALDRPGLEGAMIVSDGAPAREDVVLTWLAERLGSPPPSLEEAPESGRRIVPKRLFAAGFVPDYPDFRLGYSSLLQETE